MELTTDESDPRAFGIREVCKHTGLGRTTIYAAIKDGSLKAKKCPRATIVMASDLRAAIKDGSLKAKKCRRTTIDMVSDLRAWLMTLQRSVSRGLGRLTSTAARFTAPAANNSRRREETRPGDGGQEGDAR
jgi:hypothetical protein